MSRYRNALIAGLLLLAVLVGAVLAWRSLTAGGQAGPKAIAVSMSTVRVLSSNARLYVNEFGAPTEDTDLVTDFNSLDPPLIWQVQPDGWGTMPRCDYNAASQTVTARSAGPDRSHNTADDLVIVTNLLTRETTASWDDR